MINFNGSLYSVELFERESGYGERLLDTKYFNNLNEAKNYEHSINVENQNNTTPDWYVYASLKYLVHNSATK